MSSPVDLRPYLDREAVDAFGFPQKALNDLSAVELRNVSYLDTLLLMTIARRLAHGRIAGSEAL